MQPWVFHSVSVADNEFDKNKSQAKDIDLLAYRILELEI